MSLKIKCLVVEDEPLAQNILKKYIEEFSALELEAICTDALEAQQVLLSTNIQLIFLDINLPRLSGINFLKTISHPPLIVFTTAYPEFAVEGFELDAIDYLLKPFSFERFVKAVNRAMDKLNKSESIVKNPSPFIFLKADKKVFKVDLDSIIYLEATGDYVKVFTTNSQMMIHTTLKYIVEELPPADFLRVHKSFIIAISKINFIEGNYIRMGGTDIPIGASYKEEVVRSLKNKSGN